MVISTVQPLMKNDNYYYSIKLLFIEIGTGFFNQGLHQRLCFGVF